MFAPALDHPLLWDDDVLIRQSLEIRGLDKLPGAFNGHYLAGATDDQSQVPYYRPISLAALIVQKTVFDASPQGYRAVMFLFNLCSTLLIFFMSKRLFSTPAVDKRSPATAAALFSALVFSTLPYNMDAILFITDLGDLMVLTSILLGLLLFEKHLRDGSAACRIGSLLCAALAIGSKETGVAAPFLLGLHALLRSGSSPISRKLLVPSAAAILLVGYMAMRAAVLVNIRHFDPLTALLRFGPDFLQAFRWALFPHPLSLYEPVTHRFFGWDWWLGFLLLGGILAAALYLRRRQPPVVFLLLSFVLCIAPSLQAIQHMNWFSPRYLYVPSAALTVLAGIGFSRIHAKLRRLLWAVPILLALLSLIRIQSWQSASTLWTTQLERHPDDPLALLNYGIVQEQNNRPDEAFRAYSRGIAIATERKSEFTLSGLHFRMGQLLDRAYANPTDALRYYEMAVRYHATSTLWLSIGNIHAHDRAYDRALLAFRKAEKLAPDDFNVLISLAGALGGLHRFDEAIATINRAIAVAENSPTHLSEAKRRREILLQFRDRQAELPPPRSTLP